MKTTLKQRRGVSRPLEGALTGLTAKLLDGIEPHGISIDDVDEIRKRAEEARIGVPGIAWNDVKRGLLK
jgi:hypothetical protein